MKREKEKALGASCQALVEIRDQNGRTRFLAPIASPDLRLGARQDFRTSAQRLAPSAFTLTELLVVITIIAILASLITAGAMNALNAAKRAAITTEIGQLSQALEEFKNKYSAYPPNTVNTLTTTEQNYSGDVLYPIVGKDLERMFRKAFPRHNEPAGLIQALAGGIGSLPNNATNLDGGINAAEAVYFWLGGFSDDPIYPISGAGGPSFADGDDSGTALDTNDEVIESRARLYEFDLGRLVPRDNDIFDGRFVTYSINLNGDADTNDPGESRRINLWTYTPKGSERSYVYFDASRHKPIDYDLDLTGLAGIRIFGLKKLREGISAATAATDIEFVNKGKFQVFHAGLDDTWGDMSFFRIDEWDSNPADDRLILFPAGPFTGDLADTLTNFSTGTLESEQE